LIVPTPDEEIRTRGFNQRLSVRGKERYGRAVVSGYAGGRGEGGRKE